MLRHDYVKTDDKIIDFRISPEVASMLRARRAIEWRTNPDGAIFPARGGKWMQLNNFRRRWRIVRHELDIAYDLPEDEQEAGEARTPAVLRHCDCNALHVPTLCRHLHRRNGFNRHSRSATGTQSHGCNYSLLSAREAGGTGQRRTPGERHVQAQLAMPSRTRRGSAHAVDWAGGSALHSVACFATVGCLTGQSRLGAVALSPRGHGTRRRVRKS